jgi:hypothetical protein
MLPTVITGLTDDSTCMQEEIFGEYGMVWYGMVWYGVVWYGILWYGMV